MGKPAAFFEARALAIAFAFFTGAGLPTHLQAQEGVLEEVIVTARKREEAIQVVPVSVTAFSGEQMRDAGITNIQDLGYVTPGLQVDQSSAAQIWIRGIGQRDDGSRVDAPVGVYLDGLYIPRKDGQLLDLIDVKSVQVLRGPQGTLFGKNTTAGALIVTSNEPREEFGQHRLSRPGRTDQRQRLAGFDGDRHVPQHPVLTVREAEADVA